MQNDFIRQTEVLSNVAAEFVTARAGPGLGHLKTAWPASQYQGHISDTMPVRLALNGRLNRKSVGSPEAVPLSSAPCTSGLSISHRETSKRSRDTNASMAELGGVPVRRLAMQMPCLGVRSNLAAAIANRVRRSFRAHVG
eukprot:6194283-Pleurochrysis_carterae.AAC.3